MRGLIPALIGTLALAACGGGGGSLAPGTPTGPAANVQSIVVDGGPAALANRPDVDTLFTTVTICVPGSTTNCQTIDHIQVDTGSSGLRILASVLTLTLPQQMDAGGSALVECVQFLDGFSWGPLKAADVQVGGESASSVPVQVIGDAAYPTVPSDCSSTGPAEDTVQTFGANGILGVGPFIQDCGSGCGTVTGNGFYYSCPTSSSCAQTTVAVGQQVTNPAALFATDNNGVIIELPSVSATGASTVTGSIVFGIGTQSNNGLGGATVYTVDPGSGALTTQYNGTSLTNSFIDSGSNALYFPDSSIPVCAPSTTAPGFYCPTSTLSLSATIQGVNGTGANVNFSIANAVDLFDTSATIAAVSNIGAPNADGTSFDWGLPFFFGRNIYTAFEQHNTSGGEGPYFAF